jgi:hypothetical protein
MGIVACLKVNSIEEGLQGSSTWEGEQHLEKDIGLWVSLKERLCPQNSTSYTWASVYYSEQLLPITWQPIQSKKMKNYPLVDHCPYNRAFTTSLPCTSF